MHTGFSKTFELHRNLCSKTPSNVAIDHSVFLNGAQFTLYAFSELKSPRTCVRSFCKHDQLTHVENIDRYVRIHVRVHAHVNSFVQI